MSDNPKIIYGTLDEIEPIVSSQEAWNEFPEHIQQYLRNKSGSDLLRSFGAYWLLKKHISSEQFQSLSFTASGKPILQKNLWQSAYPIADTFLPVLSFLVVIYWV